jgi:hypothetical protein
MRLASEHLSVWVLQPTGDDLFIGEIERMLQVKQSGDKPWPQDWPSRTGLKRLGSDPVDLCPVDHIGQSHERMV